MSLRILYEDDELIFIDKPGNIVVQRGYDADEPVLLEMVERLLASRGEAPFLMQRLDRGTSGVIFFSKKGSVNARLTRQFERKAIRKEYIALCEGELRTRQWIDAPLARIGPISFGVREEGKRAVTGIEPLELGDCASLVGIRLMTGRTHQIRVHLAAIGHPLVGDWLYGERNEGRPMLHARALSMMHPATNEPLRVESPLPEDFVEACGARGIGDFAWSSS
jgi:23S rRNA pseudouridine1911/1915/1917 synthase